MEFFVLLVMRFLVVELSMLALLLLWRFLLMWR